MKVSKRIITFFLAFAMLVSLLGFASASSSSGVLVDSASVASWNKLIADNVKSGVSVTVPQDQYWSHINTIFSRYGVGSLDSHEKLVRVTTQLDFYGSGFFGIAIESVIDSFAQLWSSPDYVVMYDSALGVYRPYDNKALLWVVNSLGHFPYYRPESSGGDSGSTEPETYRTGQWLDQRKFSTSSVLWHVVSNYELNEFREQWLDVMPSARIVETTNYYWLVATTYNQSMVLCDKYGYPYYLPKEGKTAISTPNNYYQDTTNQYIDNTTNNNNYDYSTNEWITNDNSTHVNVQDGGSALVGSPIDINNGIINVGGKLAYIDNITYDASTQSYYVDAHDEYNFDITKNEYTTNFTLYRFEYNIDYTSITYIGQTEEYDERYELYYQLPDGRSSADLTAEDLEQLSVSFADVVQYQRSADDVSMRRLYHFDGNVEDSSYWSYIDGFRWNVGASLTYMDEGTFEGSLYLDETEHDFTITLPGNDIASDFTFQFRYYQSHTEVPKMDSYIMFGDETALFIDGSAYYDSMGTEICVTSVGNWQELCFMKSDGILHFYVNGVCVHTIPDNLYHTNTITFHFGSEQQTYKKLDEMRFTKRAVYTPGENYTPAAVPFDTNLSLILPDGLVPVADEVLVVDVSDNNILNNYNLSDWSDSSVVDRITDYIPFSTYNSSPFQDSGLVFYRNSVILSFSNAGMVLPISDGASVDINKVRFDGRTEASHNSNEYNEPYVVAPTGLFLCTSRSSDVSVNVPYTFSVLLADGTFSSITFIVDSSGVPSIVSSSISSSVTLDVSSVTHKRYQWYQYQEWGYDPYYGVSGMMTKTYQNTHTISTLHGILITSPTLESTIIYMELVQGESPDFSASYESAMYDPGELKNSPVLAVRTNQPITGYQIGGVRPSYPTKGLVYAMVENSRIRSLQQYSGSAWVEVDGRIWTGKRWIPYSSFDVFTLQDFYDIIGGSDDDYEYIYTESGFWSWFQKQWNKFMDKLDQILDAITGNAGSGPGSDCEHVYHTEIQREATCAEPGHMLYTCNSCGDSYTELIEPAGHDWIVQEHVEDVLDEEGNVVEKGYDVLVCSVCNLETKDYGEGPVETDLFDAIGDLIAEGIDWILDKLAQVTDSLSGITDTFNSFVDRIEGMTGEYSLMFGAFLALLPEDLRTLMWLSIIAGIVGLVWKAWAK